MIATTRRDAARRTAAPLLVLALAASLLLAAPTAAPAQEPPQFTNVDRLAVDSFSAAGVAVSQRTFEDDAAEAVVLATQDNFPDALAASAVAGTVGGPVLFTGRSATDAATRAEIDRVLVEGATVYVMGGPEAVNSTVTAALEPTYAVQRIEGPSRLETAVAAAGVVGIGERVLVARAFGPGGANTEGDRATGWVDAISCGAYAAREGIPILLTQTDVLSQATRDALAGSGAQQATICGGEAAVSSAVADQLAALGLEVARVQGVTRVETAVDVARRLFGLTSARGNAYVVVPGYGERFGFGLAAAPLGLPILLVGDAEPTDCADQSQPSRATLCYLESGGQAEADLLVVGGPALIGDAVVDAVARSAGGRDISELDRLAAPAGVEVEDDIDDGGTALTVSWDAVADPDEILAGYRVYVDEVLAGETGPDEAGEIPTELVLEDLTAEQEVSVTVTAVDVAERESDPSDAVSATPEDEVPAALTGFDADAGDARVVLTWDEGPSDAASYQIQRATASGGTCGTYADLATVEDPAATEYTDTTPVNGTAYCYRITVTDQADQTSPPATAGPVTPAIGVPDVSIQYPVASTNAVGTYTGDTVRYGTPLVVEYTATDTDTPPADLRVSVELTYSGAAGYVRVIDNQPVQFTTAGDDGPARVSIPACAVGDMTGTTCIRDADLDTLQLRLTVRDPQDRGESAASGAVRLRRTPPPVTGFAATAGPGVVTLVWDRLVPVQGLPIRYEVYKQEVQVQPDSDAGNESCSTDLADYELFRQVEQPSSGATVPPIPDSEVDADGEELPDGTQVADYLYCYRVRVLRTDLEPDLAGPTVLSSANPTEAPTVGIAVQSPSQGGILDRGTTETIRYQLSIPAGVTVSEVSLWYCLDYRNTSVIGGSATCQDTGGFKRITSGLTPADPPRANGSNTVTWAVPADASTAQPDDRTGAFEVRANGNVGRVTGILFR